MQSSSRFESLATRFGPYTEELYTFLSGCGISFGSPADLPPFVQKLSEPGYLRDGISAMIRSVIYREQEKISQVELLELVLVAVGGTQIDEDSSELEQSRRHLCRVIGQAMTSMWNMPRSSLQPLADESRFSEPPPTWHSSQIPGSPLEIQPQATADPPPRHEWSAVPIGFSIVQEHPRHAAIPAPEVPSEASPLPVSPAPHALAREPMPQPSAEPQRPLAIEHLTARLEPMKPPDAVPPARRPLEPVHVAAPPRLLWAAGLCALLIAPLVDRIAHPRSTPPPVMKARQRPRPFVLPVLPPQPDPVHAPDPSLTAGILDLDLADPPAHAVHSRFAHRDRAAKKPLTAPEQNHTAPTATPSSATAVDLPSPVDVSLRPTPQPQAGVPAAIEPSSPPQP